MEILWWLAPPVAATVLAMLWISWLGREGRGDLDPEVAARRLGRAMSRPPRVAPRATPPRTAGPGERSGGIAVRPSSRPAPRTPSGQETPPAAGSESTRRAS
jgi:hypothetical protein